jgi:hypothetical protein
MTVIAIAIQDCSAVWFNTSALFSMSFASSSNVRPSAVLHSTVALVIYIYGFVKEQPMDAGQARSHWSFVCMCQSIALICANQFPEGVLVVS